MRKYLRILLLSIVLFLSTGCGGGGSTSNNSTTTKETKVETTPLTNEESTALGNLFPDIDEEALLNSEASNVIETVANDATIMLSPVLGDKAISLSDDELVGGTFEDGIELKDSSAVKSSDIGKALFIGNEFQGMISNVTTTGSNLKIKLENAKNPTDVYSSMEIEFQNDEIKSAIQRAIRNKTSFGKYDSINKEPLKVTLIDNTSRTRAIDSNDNMILRIDIPKGYRVPSKLRAVNCDYWEADCTFDIAGSADTNYSMSYQTDDDIIFDSDGSYIEIGLSSYLKLRYNYNTISDNEIYVEGRQSAYFNANIIAKFSAQTLDILDVADKVKYEREFDILRQLNINIRHPYSNFVQIKINIAPKVNIGVEAALNGTFTYTTSIGREGYIDYAYDSKNNISKFTSDVSDNPSTTEEEDVSVGLEVSGSAYMYPNLTYLPNVTLLRVDKPISIGLFRSGVELKMDMNGNIEDGFTLLNDGEVEDTFGTEATVEVSIAGKIESKWDLKVGDWEIVQDDEFSDIASDLGKIDVFKWKASLLKDPKIIIADIANNDTQRLVTFESDDEESIHSYLTYYYSKGSAQTAEDIPVIDIDQHPLSWKTGNAGIILDEGEIIKVRSAVYNRDIAAGEWDAEWAYGMSISQQIESEMSECPENISYFETQNQNLLDGFKAYLGKNDSTPDDYQYCRYFEESGMLWIISTYEDNTKTTTLHYQIDSQLKDLEIEFYTNGVWKHSISYQDNSTLIGYEYTRYENGNLQSSVSYQEGSTFINAENTYYENGNLKTIIHYQKNSPLKDFEVELYTNDVWKHTIGYQEGSTLLSHERTYYENGNTKWSLSYQKGSTLKAHEFMYWPSGCEQRYIRYDDNGIPDRDENYADGEHC